MAGSVLAKGESATCGASVLAKRTDCGQDLKTELEVLARSITKLILDGQRRAVLEQPKTSHLR